MPSSPEGGEALNAAARVPQNTADKWGSQALRIATSVNRNGFTGASQRGDGPVINEEDIDQVIQLKTIVNQMKYDKEHLRLKAGSTVKIVFSNPDHMQHNLLILAPGSLQTVGTAADELATTPTAGDKRSEERRVGKECGSTISSRWSQYN